MNQILSTYNVNDKKNKSKARSGGTSTKDIHSVIRFFAIMLIIFGALIIGNGVIALTGGNTGSGKEQVVESKPQIKLEKKGEDKVIITVTDEVDIDNVTYSWNKEEDLQIAGASGKFVQKIIDIPDGENTLYIKALNINGGVQEETQKFELIPKIGIKMSMSGNSIKVDVTGQDEIEKISYAWDDEEPKTVEVKDKKYSLEIEAIIGEHTLKVVEVDVNGEEKKKEQPVTGTTKPTLKITKGNGAYHIEASDEIGLDRIEITTLKDGKVNRIKSDGKELEYDFPLKDNDENYVEIVAINTNDVESQRIKAKWPRQ